MLAERLPPRRENHLCGFQVASISCFAAFSAAFTASSDSGNADRVDPASLPSGMRSFLGHVSTYGSAPLKQTTDLAYHRSNQSAEIAIQVYEVDEGQVSDIGRRASKQERSFAETMAICSYHTMVCSSVEAISIRLLVREKRDFFKFCVGVEDMRTIGTMSL